MVEILLEARAEMNGSSACNIEQQRKASIPMRKWRKSDKPDEKKSNFYLAWSFGSVRE